MRTCWTNCDSLPETPSWSSTGTHPQQSDVSVGETGGRSGSGTSLKVGDGDGCCRGGWVFASVHARSEGPPEIAPLLFLRVLLLAHVVVGGTFRCVVDAFKHGSDDLRVRIRIPPS